MFNSFQDQFNTSGVKRETKVSHFIVDISFTFHEDHISDKMSRNLQQS